MADIETDGPVIRRFMARLAVTARFGCAADLNRKHVRSRRDTNDAPEALLRRPTRSRRMVRAHHVNLAGLFWIGPIGAAENGRTRLQEG